MAANVDFELDDMKKEKSASGNLEKRSNARGPAHGDEAGYYEAYAKHADILRSWLVAYGVGVPVLILSQEGLWKVMLANGVIVSAGLSFVIGVALQAALALINKVVMWNNYRGASSWKFRHTRTYWFLMCLSAQFWVDIVFDIVTIVAFVHGTLQCFFAFRL